MRRIILAYSYGFNNPGDYAITPGTINALRSVNENTFITVISSGNNLSDKYLKTKKILEDRYEHLEVIPNDLFETNVKKSTFTKVKSLGQILLYGSSKQINSKGQTFNSIGVIFG